jgi:hypothetical protein
MMMAIEKNILKGRSLRTTSHATRPPRMILMHDTEEAIKRE